MDPQVYYNGASRTPAGGTAPLHAARRSRITRIRVLQTVVRAYCPSPSGINDGNGDNVIGLGFFASGNLSVGDQETIVMAYVLGASCSQVSQRVAAGGHRPRQAPPSTCYPPPSSVRPFLNRCTRP